MSQAQSQSSGEASCPGETQGRGSHSDEAQGLARVDEWSDDKSSMRPEQWRLSQTEAPERVKRSLPTSPSRQQLPSSWC